MDNNQNQPAGVPQIPESELKMPAEQVASNPQPAPVSKGPISPLLIVLLVIALALLGAVLVWSEEIIDLIMPIEQPVQTVQEETPMATTTQERQPTAEEDLANIEAEASSTEKEFSDVDSELQSIEAEINAEAQ